MTLVAGMHWGLWVLLRFDVYHSTETTFIDTCVTDVSKSTHSAMRLTQPRRTLSKVYHPCVSDFVPREMLSVYCPFLQSLSTIFINMFVHRARQVPHKREYR